MVDTSQLIKDERDILSTWKVACVLENGQLYNQAVSSRDKKNIISKIFYEKTRLRSDMAKERNILGGDRCLLSKDPTKISKLLNSDVYLVAERNLADFFLSGTFLVSGALKKLWISESRIFEYKKVIYYHAEKTDVGPA